MDKVKKNTFTDYNAPSSEPFKLQLFIVFAWRNEEKPQNKDHSELSPSQDFEWGISGIPCIKSNINILYLLSEIILTWFISKHFLKTQSVVDLKVNGEN
jgi:hypothetical protein